MASSTSLFNALVPWKACWLLGVAMLAWAGGAVYTVRLNPEVAYDRHSHALKSAWQGKLDDEHPSKVVFFGGSSCRTSINGERMLLKYGLPVVNLGLSAGMGAKIQAEYALQALRPGDTLVIAVEPPLLTGPIILESPGIQFALAIGEPKLLRDPDYVNWPSALLTLRPGSYHVFTLLGKIALHHPLFRYPQSDLHPDGWQETIERRAFADLIPGKYRLSSEAKAWAAHIRDVCHEKRVRVCYSLPWFYSTPECQCAFRQQNAKFLIEMSEFFPVLKDPMLGAYTVRKNYADTPLHLTGEGAAIRSDQAAEAIKNWETWSLPELTLLGCSCQ